MNPIIELLASDRIAKRAVDAFSTALLMVTLASLAACGGGASTETNPATGNNTNVTPSSYNGPNAATEDIRGFQINVWDRLKDSSRCGACHVEGSQSPMFVRQDDVNLAYSEANPLINLDAPASSRLATKVAGGHNCWLSSNAACATAITSYIGDWVASTSGAGRQIQLVAPVVVNPGSTLTFPSAVPPEFSVDPGGVWPLLMDNCAGCHIDSSATPQTPFFASDNVNDAYEAVKSKINLSDPASSRLVVRLRDEFHNCWTQCDADADEMQAAINLLAAAPTVTSDPVQAPTVFSNAMRLPDGIVASGGNRHEADVIALYEFKTGSGNIALDSSGVLPELNLTLSGDVNWVGGWGIEIVDGKVQGSTANSKKLHDLITATGEYAIEAWVAPGNVVQEGPARIVSYSAGTSARNFTLGQTQYNYDFLHRSSTTDANGEAALSTADADEDLQATLQHVVVTFDPVNGRRIYINGVSTDDVDPAQAGNLNDWDDSFAFVLGNEVSGDRLWTGTIRMVAIHNRALTQEQITQNFEVGVGEKFFLLFGIGDIINLPQSYIMFEVAQYDSYSYLFNKPTFINLDPNTVPGNIPLTRMSIGINGHVADVGQAYRTLDTAINGNSYDPDTGQILSDLGTIIPLENGPQVDEFYLTFEVLGGESNVVTENSPLTPPPLPAPAEVSDIGVRTFDEINASLAAITGVDPQQIKAEFDILRQQLPAVETIEGFLSAHQMAIAQLSISYCSALVDDPVLRGNFFGGFAFGSDVATAFGVGDSVEKNQFVSDLYDRAIGLPGTPPATPGDLTNAATRAEFKAVLIGPSGAEPNNLYDTLAGSCLLPDDCDATRTLAVAKALCGSALGSAAMLIQ